MFSSEKIKKGVNQKIRKKSAFIPIWQPPCKNLNEVKAKYPNPDPDMCIFLKEADGANPGETWIAVVNDYGEWEQVLFSKTQI